MAVTYYAHTSLHALGNTTDSLYQELSNDKSPGGVSWSLPGFGSLLRRTPHIVVLFCVPCPHFTSGIPHSDQRNSSGTENNKIVHPDEGEIKCSKASKCSKIIKEGFDDLFEHLKI